MQNSSDLDHFKLKMAKKCLHFFFNIKKVGDRGAGSLWERNFLMNNWYNWNDAPWVREQVVDTSHKEAMQLQKLIIKAMFRYQNKIAFFKPPSIQLEEKICYFFVVDIVVIMTGYESQWTQPSSVHNLFKVFLAASLSAKFWASSLKNYSIWYEREHFGVVGGHEEKV